MRFYRAITDGRWHTSADRAGKGAEPFDVPTDKSGLLGWLNDNVRADVLPDEPAEMRERQLREDTDAPAMKPLQLIEAFKALPDGMRSIAVEEEIQGCGGMRLASLTSQVISRIEELRRDAQLERVS